VADRHLVEFVVAALARGEGKTAIARWFPIFHGIWVVLAPLQVRDRLQAWDELAVAVGSKFVVVIAGWVV
jgi:hypothetical protein